MNPEVTDVAGHGRTTATGKARRTPSGRTRKVREHLPDGQSAAAKRAKQHQGARRVTADRLRKAKRLITRENIARSYIGSARAKFSDPDTAEFDRLHQAYIDAMVALGDHIFRHGPELTASARKTRRDAKNRRRQDRHDTGLIHRAGVKSLAEKQAGARRA